MECAKQPTYNCGPEVDMVFEIEGEAVQGRAREADRLRVEAMQRFLELDIWANIRPEALGTELTREEEEAILGYGPSGA